MIRTDVTRAICWLPPRSPDYKVSEVAEGNWRLKEETWRWLGRIGYRVTTETFLNWEDYADEYGYG